MTTDPDKLLADAIARLKSIDDRYPGPQSTPLSTGLMFAGVLLATRRELAEARERIAIMTPAITDLRCDVEGLRAPATVHVVNQPPDQRPLIGHLKHGPGGTGGPGPCDPDCAKCRVENVGSISVIAAPRPNDDSPEAWRADIRAALPESQRAHFDRGDFVECATCCTKSGMPTLCAHCLANRATVSGLRAALREALDRWQGWNDQEYTGTKHHAPAAARIAELRRLVSG